MTVTIYGTNGVAFAARPSDIEVGQKTIVVRGQLVLSGNYVTGGDTIDFTAIASYLPSTVLRQLKVWSQAGQLAHQLVPSGGPATALNAWRLFCGAASTFGTQLAAAAYPAALTGDTIMFEATFEKLA